MPSTTPVPAPPATQPEHGLLVALDPFRGAERWQNPEAVISYRPEGCNQNGAAFDTCDTGTSSYTGGPDTVSWKSYGLRYTEKCSTFSGIDENESRVRRGLVMDTERQLGEEFWSGNLAQSGTLPDGSAYPNLWLANTASDDLTGLGGPVALTHALACLDQYLSDNNSGQLGAIHCTSQTLDHWYGPLHLLERTRTERGIRYFSPMGNLVIASAGYNGGSPEGRLPATNDIWAYATDVPRLFLGDIQTFPVMNSIDRVNNTVEMVAQRVGLVEWSLCRHAAIQLAMTTCSSDGS